MKHLTKLIILTIGILLLTLVPVMANQAADEAAIREAYKKALTAYNNHDLKAFAALHVEDFEDWEGITKGRAGLEKITTSRAA